MDAPAYSVDAVGAQHSTDDHTPVITPERVREVLLATWGEQSCQNETHWPETLKRLLAGSEKRCGFKLRVDEACNTIAAACANGAPTDLYSVIWRAFAMLDHEHRTKLVERLKAAVVAAKLEERA